MTATPVCADAGDAERLAALDRYAILDTPAETGFDDVVALATQICGARIGVVNFIASDRQWFKAVAGLDARDAPLEVSICVHALSEVDLLVIPDLRADARTGANPLVTGAPRLRFYAGAVLRTPDGHALGTICVLDQKPRPGGLTADEEAALLALARQVMTMLELRHAMAEREAAEAKAHADATALRDTTVRLGLAIDAAELGAYDYDLVTGALSWDARVRELFGVTADEPVSYDTFLAGLHPDDRGETDRTVVAALDPANGGVLNCDYRTVGANDGQVRWLASRGKLVMENGRALRLVGTVRDVTAANEAEAAVAATLERYRLVGRATNDAIWDWDLVDDHVLWNEALTSAYGYDLIEVVPNGEWWLDRVHADDRARVEADIRGVIGGTESDWEHEYRFRRADGEYADVLDRGYMVRADDGAPVRMIGAMLDLTERKRAEEEFRTLFEGANVGVVQFDPASGRAVRVNPKMCQIWGTTAADILGQPLGRWTHPDDQPERVALYDRLARGERTSGLIEKRYVRRDGRVILGRVNLVSRRVGEGVQTTAMVEDITAEKRAATLRDALGALGDRLRDVDDTAEITAAAAEIIGQALGVVRAAYGAADVAGAVVEIERDWTAPGFESLAGRRDFSELGVIRPDALRSGAAVSLGDDASAPGLPSGVGAALAAPVLEHGRLVALLLLHDQSPRIWTPEELAFVQRIADRTRAAVARVQAEEQQRLLNREISHRMKNILAMVQGIASQTMRSAPDMASARETLSNRLVALSKAHEVLLGGPLGRADLGVAIREAVRLVDDPAGRIAVAGPEIEIGPQTTLSLGLMLHELGTNAVKYGALSTPDGQIDIGWRVWLPDGAAARLFLTWRERGGPPVVPPARNGFGSRLIERSLAARVGGTVTLDYAADGLVCTLDAPLGGFLESS